MATVLNQVQNVNNIFLLADKLKELRGLKDDLEEQVKEIKVEIEQVEQAMVELMLQEEIPNFTRNGQKFYLQTKTFASAIAERKQELFSWLKENGFGDLVQETVNANSLAAFVREQLAECEQLPAELAELVNVYEKTVIGIRKAN